MKYILLLTSLLMLFTGCGEDNAEQRFDEIVKSYEDEGYDADVKFDYGPDERKQLENLVEILNQDSKTLGLFDEEKVTFMGLAKINGCEVFVVGTSDNYVGNKLKEIDPTATYEGGVFESVDSECIER